MGGCRTERRRRVKQSTCTTHAITHPAARTRPFGELHEPSMEPSLVRTQLLSLRVSVMPPPALLLECLLQLRALQGDFIESGLKQGHSSGCIAGELLGLAGQGSGV